MYDQNEFFDLLAACADKPLALADDNEPTFFQNPERGDIVFDNTGIQGAHPDVTQKR
jgi:hypothetical protein